MEPVRGRGTAQRTEAFGRWVRGLLPAGEGGRETRLPALPDRVRPVSLLRADVQSAAGEARRRTLLVDQGEGRRTHPLPWPAGRPRACRPGGAYGPAGETPVRLRAGGGGAGTDTRQPVGIDVGITNRVALSDGTRLPGVRLDRRELKRRLSRARKGSNNRRKRRRELAREWQRVTDRERGLAHELTTRIVREHGANIAVEELNIPGMVSNRRLPRRIMEQQWGRLAGQLAYKAESAGGRLSGSRRRTRRRPARAVAGGRRRASPWR